MCLGQNAVVIHDPESERLHAVPDELAGRLGAARAGLMGNHASLVVNPVVRPPKVILALGLHHFRQEHALRGAVPFLPDDLHASRTFRFRILRPLFSA